MYAALISGAAALVVCIINNIYTNKATQNQHDKTVAIIEYRIEELTKKVEKHNNLIERMAVVERDLESAWSRIDDIVEELKR